MKTWKVDKLGSLCADENCFIQTGPFGAQLHESDYSDEGVPVVMPMNIVGGKLSENGIARVNENHVSRLARYKTKKGDILFGRRGDIGRQALVTQKEKGWLCGTGCLLIRPSRKLVDSYFLNNYFKQPSVIDYVSNQAIGATMPNLNTGILKNLPILLPPLPIQRKIAAVLSAYDDLIENNTRRITILEKMAEELYREWFVRLRFPEHERTKIVKGVPVGWELRKIGSVVSTQYGYTASADMEIEGPKFLRITDIVPGVISWESVPNCKIEQKDEEKYTLHEGDIVVARTGATVGYAKRINKLHPKSIFASYLVRLIPRDNKYGIYLGLSVERNSFKDFINMFVTGAAQPQANANTMSLFPLFYPAAKTIATFNRKVESILDLKERLYVQSSLLTKTRDRLLSRLMSGKIDLERLDIHFPPSMREEEMIHA